MSEYIVLIPSEQLAGQPNELQGRLFSSDKEESVLTLKVDDEISKGIVVLTPTGSISPNFCNILRERGRMQTTSGCGRRVELIVDYT